MHRTSCGKFAKNFPGLSAIGRNADLATAPKCANACTTSLPTSNFCGPIAGPIHAITSSAPAARIAATVFSNTPEAKPRQPACAAATTEPL